MNLRRQGMWLMRTVCFPLSAGLLTNGWAKHASFAFEISTEATGG